MTMPSIRLRPTYTYKDTLVHKGSSWSRVL